MQEDGVHIRQKSIRALGDLGARRSLTAFLRPPKVPRHAGFPRGDFCLLLQVVFLGKETLRCEESILGSAFRTHSCGRVREAGLRRERSWAMLHHNRALSQGLWSWKGSTELS